MLRRLVEIHRVRPVTRYETKTSKITRMQRVSHVAAFWSMNDVISPLDPLDFVGAAAALRNSIVSYGLHLMHGICEAERTAFWASARLP